MLTVWASQSDRFPKRYLMFHTIYKYDSYAVVDNLITFVNIFNVRMHEGSCTSYILNWSNSPFYQEFQYNTVCCDWFAKFWLFLMLYVSSLYLDAVICHFRSVCSIKMSLLILFSIHNNVYVTRIKTFDSSWG